MGDVELLWLRYFALWWWTYEIRGQGQLIRIESATLKSWIFKISTQLFTFLINVPKILVIWSYIITICDINYMMTTIYNKRLSIDFTVQNGFNLVTHYLKFRCWHLIASDKCSVQELGWNMKPPHMLLGFYVLWGERYLNFWHHKVMLHRGEKMWTRRVEKLHQLFLIELTLIEKDMSFDSLDCGATRNSIIINHENNVVIRLDMWSMWMCTIMSHV